MRQVELAYQAIQRASLFERIQVLALDVLDKRHRNRRLVRNLLDDRRDFVESGHLGGAPAAFAGDDLVAAVADRPGDDRLHDALGLDRICEVLERILANVGSRLVLAALQEIDGE